MFNKKLLILIVSFILTIAIINPPWLSKISPENSISRKLYAKAIEYQKNNDFEAAYQSYKKISPRYVAYDIVLFQESKCAAALEDEKTAVKKLKRLISKYSSTPILSQAYYALGQAYVRVGENDKAKKQFVETIEKFPETNYAYGSYYYLGMLNAKENPDEALKFWIEYLDVAPDGRFAADCIDGITLLKEDLSIIDIKKLAKSLFVNQKSSRAIFYLEKLPVSDSWYILARAYNAVGNNQKALCLLKEGLSKYSKDLSREDIEIAMNLYKQLSFKPDKDDWTDIIAFSQVGKDIAFYNKAILYSKTEVLSLYTAIADNYPDSDYAPESLWQMFWNKYTAGKYNDSINIGKRHISSYTNVKSSPKVIYWVAKAYEKIGNSKNALQYYKKLLKIYPDSYYSFRAISRIESLNTGYDAGWKQDFSYIPDKTNSNKVIPYTYKELSDKFSPQLAESLLVKDYDMAESLSREDSFIKSWINLQQGMVSRSIVLARNAMNELTYKPESQDARWKLIYQVYYSDEIDDYAKINNLDPLIVLSLMKEESHFNPLATSSSNARGLMQLLPGTARDIARWKNMQTPNDFVLYTPETNIRLGTAYLSYIKKMLDNNMLLAVAAYNGGPGAVESWLSRFSTGDMDQFIENIPYDQTRDYVKKVYASYWNYKRIYNSN